MGVIMQSVGMSNSLIGVVQMRSQNDKYLIFFLAFLLVVIVLLAKYLLKSIIRGFVLG